jgi:DNA modification methylase
MAIRCLNEAHGEGYVAYHGDCCDVVPQLPKESIDFSIYSVPFGNLFVYGDSEADMGNCVDDAEFSTHYGFLTKELLRVTKPGRLCAVHCSDLPVSKWRTGHIATNRFSDLMGEIHEANGWHFVRRVTIWKDPVVEQTRTNAMNLLYKQLIKDSSKSWPGSPDYIMVFRAPGDNEVPVGHKPDNFPLEQWQKWASPVWMDIRQTNTLNVQMAKDNKDTRHICPLQLDLIERCIIMWSNQGDVVLSPFMGVGSEGVISAKLRRKFIGVELKETYWKAACKNVDNAERGAPVFFDMFESA